jgi:hypothetical protein
MLENTGKLDKNKFVFDNEIWECNVTFKLIFTIVSVMFRSEASQCLRFTYLNDIQQREIC